MKWSWYLLEELREVIRSSGRILSPGRYVNSAPSVYKAGLIATRWQLTVVVMIIIIIIIISVIGICAKPKV
jgi:hypothetical protein